METTNPTYRVVLVLVQYFCRTVDVNHYYNFFTIFFLSNCKYISVSPHVLIIENAGEIRFQDLFPTSCRVIVALCLSTLVESTNHVVNKLPSPSHSLLSSYFWKMLIGETRSDLIFISTLNYQWIAQAVY